MKIYLYEKKIIKDLIDNYNKAKKDLFEYAKYRIEEYELIYKKKFDILSVERRIINDKLKEMKNKLDIELEQRNIKYEKFNFMSKEELLKIYVDNNDIFLSLLDN